MLHEKLELEVQSRRKRALELTGGAPLFVVSAPSYLRNGDVEHDFRPGSDFFYLTGFEEPESALLLFAGEQGEPQMVLFLRPSDPEREIWDGRRLGLVGAKEELGASEAFDIEELEKKLPQYLRGQARLYYTFAENEAVDALVMRSLRAARRGKRGQQAPAEIHDARKVLHEQRAIKSEYELERMQRAASISAEAHAEAMRVAQAGLNEFDLQAALERVFRAGGARRQAYGSIVGSGANATILHYHENHSPLKDGDLVLIDAGCEFEYYAADITRTFPVSGKFSEPAAELYQIVLDAQEASIQAAQVGASFDSIHDCAVAVLAEGLKTLGFIDSQLAGSELSAAVSKFYMHRTGHFLGMDVHDVGAYYQDGEPRRLEENMVLTVEPGLYVAEDDLSVPERYRGIGIRIEDDIVIKRTGPLNLTAAVPTSIKEIEALCAEAPRWKFS